MLSDHIALYRAVAMTAVAHQAATILWKHGKTCTSLDMETVSLLVNTVHFILYYSDYKQALADFILVSDTTLLATHVSCCVVGFWTNSYSTSVCIWDILFTISGL